MEGRMKGATTLPRDDYFSNMLWKSMNAINKARAKEILAEKGDIEKPKPKTIRCAKCGAERPETEYDCHTINCNYGMGD